MLAESIIADLRYGIRALLRRPIVTLVAIIAIAVGAGGSTAMFTIIDRVLLRPLSIENPERLTAIWTIKMDSEATRGYVSYLDYLDWRARSRSFEEMGAWFTRDLSMTGAGDPARVNVAYVTPSLFSVWRERPLKGRLFEAAEGRISMRSS